MVKPLTNRKMKAKYKVVAPYPESPFKIGDILTYTGITTNAGDMYSNNLPQAFVRDPQKYPHIFKRHFDETDLCKVCGQPFTNHRQPNEMCPNRFGFFEPVQ